MGILLLAGCASLPRDVPRTETYALTGTAETRAARLAAANEAQHPGQTGLHLLPDGLEALEARLALVDLAERSIDVQTYQWMNDLAGHALALRLLKAADRGVRVRVLVDDFLLVDRDAGVAAFDSHPNIEVRLYNPFGARREFLPIAKIRRNWNLVTDLDRLNHRMHNKSFTVDNEMSIVGGRNVANYYYGLGEKFNFVDFDVLMSGPQVPDVSRCFDEYWNSSFAYPITAFRRHPEAEETARLLAALRAEVARGQQQIGIPDSYALEQQNLERFVAELQWANVEVVFDDPDKTHGRNPGTVGTEVQQRLREIGSEAKSEVIIISPYLVPGPIKGTLAESLLARGVKVRMLTNSLASTNQTAVHAGYKRYRAEMIRAGIELHEMQAEVPKLVQQPRVPWSTGRTSLHAKVMVFDRREVFVGTFNLDPRSLNLNTEMGLIVHDSGLAAQIADMADRVLAPEASWRVTQDAKGGLLWQGVEDGAAVAHTSEPDASAWRKFQVFLASMLPIEDKL